MGRIRQRRWVPPCSPGPTVEELPLPHVRLDGYDSSEDESSISDMSMTFHQEESQLEHSLFYAMDSVVDDQLMSPGSFHAILMIVENYAGTDIPAEILPAGALDDSALDRDLGSLNGTNNNATSNQLLRGNFKRSQSTDDNFLLSRSYSIQDRDNSQNLVTLRHPQEWRVVSSNGVSVKGLLNRKMLKKNDVVHVIARRGNQVKITKPISGWCRTTNKLGEILMLPLPNRTNSKHNKHLTTDS